MFVTYAIYSTNYSAHKHQILSAYDSRVKLFREDGFDWDGYTKVEQSGVLEDIEVVDWQLGHDFSHLNCFHS